MLDRPHPTPEVPTLDERALARALSGKHFIGGAFVPAPLGQDLRRGQPGDRRARSAQAAEGDAADVEAAVAERGGGAEGVGADAGPQARGAGRRNAPRC